MESNLKERTNSKIKKVIDLYKLLRSQPENENKTNKSLSYKVSEGMKAIFDISYSPKTCENFISNHYTSFA